MLNEFVSHEFEHYIIPKRIVKQKYKNSKKVEMFVGEKDKTQSLSFGPLARTPMHVLFMVIRITGDRSSLNLEYFAFGVPRRQENYAVNFPRELFPSAQISHYTFTRDERSRKSTSSPLLFFFGLFAAHTVTLRVSTR